MQIAGMKMSSPWATRALRNKDMYVEQATGVGAESEVQMERISFIHSGESSNYRPMLHLVGELRSLIPDEPLPYGVDVITFDTGTGPIIDAFYEFDDEQLMQLVSKGYFTEGFQPPGNLVGIPWTLPVSIDASIIVPEYMDDAPVVFIEVHGQTELALDMENSGYDVAAYFENQLTAEAVAEQLAQAVQNGPNYSAEGQENLFDGEDFVAPNARQVAEAEARFASEEGSRRSTTGFPVVANSLFEELMAEFEEKRAEEAALAAAEPEQFDPDTVEGLYQAHVAAVEPEHPVVEELEEPALEPVPVDTNEDELDLGSEDEELGIKPISSGPRYTSGSRVTGEARVQRTRAHEAALAADAAEQAESGPELG